MNIKNAFKILINFLFFIYLVKDSNLKEKKQIKICLCTMGKEENLYAKEFIEYYINLGFDHLFIYDNNNPNSEKISDILEDKYKNKVTIYDYTQINITNQPDAYNLCYKNNKILFDWILMIDMDEFLFIVNDTLKNYLSNEIFKKCDFIEYYWVLPSDNNLIYYDSRPLFERFNGSFVKSSLFKTMVKGNISNLVYHVHSPKYIPDNKIFCNNEGKIIKGGPIPDLDEKSINIKKAYMIHYRFKSTEEFIRKYKRGYSYWLGKRKKKFFDELMYWYFWVNNITIEKIDYIEKQLNISLKYYREKYEEMNNLTYKKNF